MSLKPHSEDCDSTPDESIRRRVWGLLDKNPLLKPKQICKKLGLPYQTYKAYVTNERWKWKNNSQLKQGSNCSLHKWLGWAILPDVVGLVRARAVEVGWKVTRSRNRWLLWRDKLGRLMWFSTGRVNLYVRKPGNLGRAYQLICNAFSFTGLVTDMQVLRQILDSVRFKGAHYVFPTGRRMPMLTIDLFAKSNGIVIKVGDTTDPNSIEVQLKYMDWAERNERLLKDLLDRLNRVDLGISSPENNATEGSRGRFYVS